MQYTDDTDVLALRDRYEKRLSDRALASRSLLSRCLGNMKTKISDELYNYGKALENSGKAVFSILRGITMERFLSEERLAKESARVAETNAADDQTIADDVS